MKQFLLTIIILLAASSLTRAQQADTTQIEDTDRRSGMAWSQVTLASGRKVEGYFSLISTGLEK